MSRRSFRVDVAAPRPPAAWLLVTVAGAMLWITQQLAPWVVGVQIAAILLSLFRRERPFAWQSSPLALNAGMFGIVAVTIEVALRGGPSTLSLAHFAALTQGLQLLDARPRRTEYLLVTMALFQVILASNLTDSVFFPPLLVVFVFAVVWTLLVHTLRSEAAEAGQAIGLARAFTPGLVRMTALASAAAVMLALVIFLVLPRMRTSVVAGSPFGALAATAGFSDHVELGDIGRIRQDPTVVLRVETLQGDLPGAPRRYWRGLAFDAFDGHAWKVTPSGRAPIAGSPESGVSIGPRSERVNLVQQIVREPVAAGVIFGMGEARGLHGTVRRLERDENGGLYAAGQSDERIRYTLSSEARVPSDRALRRDRALPPPRSGDRYLQLPALDPRVGALAREIVADAERDADRVRALERYLLRQGRYSDTPPAAPKGSERSPVEAFLFGELAGHCEYFASALVVLARSVGLPARLVNGFAGGQENRIGDFVEVARSDAHAWVEVHYEGAGWVRYDATPPDLRARPEVAASLAGRARELASALELWWFQRVVGFDRSDQMRALKQLWLAWRGHRDRRERPRLARSRGLPDWGAVGSLPWEEAGWVVAVVATGGLLLWRVRRAGRGAGPPAAYAEGLRLLARRGLVRPQATPARDFARDAGKALPEAADRAFGELTEAYLRERFGGRASPEARDSVRALRAALRG